MPTVENGPGDPAASALDSLKNSLKIFSDRVRGSDWEQTFRSAEKIVIAAVALGTAYQYRREILSFLGQIAEESAKLLPNGTLSNVYIKFPFDEKTNEEIANWFIGDNSKPSVYDNPRLKVYPVEEITEWKNMKYSPFGLTIQKMRYYLENPNTEEFILVNDFALVGSNNLISGINPKDPNFALLLRSIYRRNTTIAPYLS